MTHYKANLLLLPPPHTDNTTKAMVLNTVFRSQTTSTTATGFLLYLAFTVAGILILWAAVSSISPSSFITYSHSELDSDPDINTNSSFSSLNCTQVVTNIIQDSPRPTFYNDPTLTYTVEPLHNLKDWDRKRRHWLKYHPQYIPGVLDRILLVSGSQSGPCLNPIGDHLLLRFFKNKVDYSRIHGYDIFYNNNLFQPKMETFWAKIPLIRAAMVAHPEAEWIWWVDSDAAFTDMEFKLPLQRYKDHNFVIHGWPHLIYEKKSWVALNAGIFLIRNCQWSLDFMDVWANMGPISPDYDEWGKILKSTFKEKIFPDSDDQSALVYLLLKEKEKWGDKVYLEHEYYFQGYWLDIVDTIDDIDKKYMEIERKVSGLRRRHAEKVSEFYAAMREKYLKKAGYGKGSWRRPFITHFAGCQPCGGAHSKMYSWETCWNGMQKVLNFADNQILRNFGFMHRNLSDSSSVSPLPFDFPLRD